MSDTAAAAFAEGFAALAEVHDPSKSWTFGESAFSGLASALKPDDPRLQGSSDRLFELVVHDGAPVLKRGDEIQQSGKRYRLVHNPDHNPANGWTTLLLALA